MDLPELRRVLLDLIGTAPIALLPALTEAEWAVLDRIAAQHRLQPLLHHYNRDRPGIPPDLARRWQAAHREYAMLAMVQQAELAETAALLDRAGIPSVALKGAWLAAHAYPAAALRPMRDIDLLVPAAAVRQAFDLLLAAGHVEVGPAGMTLDEIVRIDKHMPPLIAPRGTTIELHHRLWEHDGRLDHASPVASEEAVLARAGRAADGIGYPSPQDLLGHVIVHAVYSHRLDCGPLVLRYHPDAAIDFSEDTGEPAPAELLSAAPDLLLQDLETRASAGLAATTIKQGAAGLAGRLTGRRKVKGEAVVTRSLDSEGGLLGWAGSRALRSLRDLARADVRRQSRQLAALSQWLDR